MVSHDNLWTTLKGQTLFSQNSGVKNTYVEMWYVLGRVDDSSVSSPLFKIRKPDSLKSQLPKGAHTFNTVMKLQAVWIFFQG